MGRNGARAMNEPGGKHYQVTKRAFTGSEEDWKKMQDEFTLMDWINVTSFFELPLDKEIWIKRRVAELVEAEQQPR